MATSQNARPPRAPPQLHSDLREAQSFDGATSAGGRERLSAPPSPSINVANPLCNSRNCCKPRNCSTHKCPHKLGQTLSRAEASTRTQGTFTKVTSPTRPTEQQAGRVLTEESPRSPPHLNLSLSTSSALPPPRSLGALITIRNKVCVRVWVQTHGLSGQSSPPTEKQ